MATQAEQQEHGTNGAGGAIAGYTDDPMPLRGYAALLAGFITLLAGFLLGLRRSERELPERIPVTDLALLGVATFKATRVGSKDLITAPLRAPFTRFEQLAGPNEVTESARGNGVRQAIGELLICPYCLGAWVAGGFVSAHAVAPRPTRFVATTLTVNAIADELYNRTA